MQNTLKDFGDLVTRICYDCSHNETGCPSACKLITKAEEIPFEKIKASYERNKGNLHNVKIYIKNYRFNNG